MHKAHRSELHVKHARKTQHRQQHVHVRPNRSLKTRPSSPTSQLATRKLKASQQKINLKSSQSFFSTNTSVSSDDPTTTSPPATSFPQPTISPHQFKLIPEAEIADKMPSFEQRSAYNRWVLRKMTPVVHHALHHLLYIHGMFRIPQGSESIDPHIGILKALDAYKVIVPIDDADTLRQVYEDELSLRKENTITTETSIEQKDIDYYNNEKRDRQDIAEQLHDELWIHLCNFSILTKNIKQKYTKGYINGLIPYQPWHQQHDKSSNNHTSSLSSINPYNSQNELTVMDFKNGHNLGYRTVGDTILHCLRLLGIYDLPLFTLDDELDEFRPTLYHQWLTNLPEEQNEANMRDFVRDLCFLDNQDETTTSDLSSDVEQSSSDSSNDSSSNSSSDDEQNDHHHKKRRHVLTHPIVEYTGASHNYDTLIAPVIAQTQAFTRKFILPENNIGHLSVIANTFFCYNIYASLDDSQRYDQLMQIGDMAIQQEQRLLYEKQQQLEQGLEHVVLSSNSIPIDINGNVDNNNNNNNSTFINFDEDIKPSDYAFLQGIIAQFYMQKKLNHQYLLTPIIDKERLVFFDSALHIDQTLGDLFAHQPHMSADELEQDQIQTNKWKQLL